MFSLVGLGTILLVSVTNVNSFDWQDSGSVRWAFNCDWNGGDIGNVQVSGEDCGGKCVERSDCTRFTWTDFNGGTCWLKSGDNSESQAVSKNDGNAVCGYKTGGGGGTGSGKSTRYWDCCKVSCGWSGKAPVSSPVKSCEKNGYNGADINAQSGCYGGPSYACNNNQPWAINDQLSYGFAAAHLTGQSESDWCCACYKLTFINTAVAGKSLVVQVTNTGGDLGENHFDLMIPGGGVGIFNGCQSQWGAPGDGWGSRYGGVGSLGECDQLPSEIRDGCKWRFNWFQNADNPNFNMQKVACPSELTDRTGCRRSNE